jgi:hypothetical protein
LPLSHLPIRTSAPALFDRSELTKQSARLLCFFPPARRTTPSLAPTFPKPSFHIASSHTLFFLPLLDTIRSTKSNSTDNRYPRYVSTNPTTAPCVRSSRCVPTSFVSQSNRCLLSPRTLLTLASLLQVHVGQAGTCCAVSRWTRLLPRQKLARRIRVLITPQVSRSVTLVGSSTPSSTVSA